ncbi:MAG TPA: hypothetical protein VI489_04820 [Candidatus Brocadiaceae bacterium]
MEMTGIATYNKPSIHTLHVTYSKPEPNTFDNILKLESQSRESRVESQNPGLQTPDSGLTTHSFMEQMKTYKEDQLLSNPGGDSIFVDADGKVVNIEDSPSFGRKGLEQNGFMERVGKDIKDAKSNLVNMLKDASYGSKFCYKDQDGEIKEGQRVGFVKTLENFFKDLFSGLSLGEYTPGTENKPSGVPETAKYSLKKIFVDAMYNDAVVGIPRGVVQIVEDAALACLNLTEAIPDATVGNTKTGEIVTTKVFDDTQVALDFVADVLPGGKGRGRVYAFKFDKGLKGLPLIHNLTTPEQGTNETDFKYVRNTSFRKTIETISSIIPIGTAL